MIKRLRLPDYNYNFNTENGFFERWGTDKNNDPQFSPIGPEIMDIEITTSCFGSNGVLCKFCYKSNNPNGKNMSFETFKTVFDKINPVMLEVTLEDGTVRHVPKDSNLKVGDILE